MLLHGGQEHVTFAFMRGAALPDPEKLGEGTGNGVRHVTTAERCRSEEAGRQEIDSGSGKE